MMVPEQLRSWLEIAASTPSADNSQCWRFEPRGESRFAVHYARRSETTLFGAGDHASLISMGAMDGLLSLAGAEVTWEDDVAGAPYFTARVSSAPDPSILAQVLARHTNRFPYAKSEITSRSHAALAQIPRANVRLTEIASAEKLRALAQAIGAASKRRFVDRAQHESLMESLRFTPEQAQRGDGLDIATMHLPPLGGAFMKFIRPWSRAEKLQSLGLASMMAKAETDLFRQAGGAIAIIGEDSRGAARAAGAAMARAWVALNAANVAVHPFYVVTDQLMRPRCNRYGHSGALESAAQSARDSIAANDLLALQRDEIVHMLLRVGHAKRPARARAKRRSLEALLLPA